MEFFDEEVMKVFKRICLVLAAAFLMAGCKQEEDEFNGLVISSNSSFVEAEEEVTFCATFYKDGSADSNEVVNFCVESDSTGGAVLKSESAKSGEYVLLKVGTVAGGFVKVAVECNGYSAYKIFGVNPSEEILVSDKAIGFAGLGVDMSKMVNMVTVSTGSELKQYAKRGGYVIFVEGSIDMSEGILPAEGSVMDGSSATDKMNSFVASNSEYSTYGEWIKNTTNVSVGDNTGTTSISNAYKKIIQIAVANNTAIIGLDRGGYVRGGSFSVKDVSNVVIRNLSLKDAVDPFPHHESGDGWNAQHDLVSIDNGKNIWIDHCTFEDTLNLGKAANGEKWQVYDGLCDMKSTTTNVTVSNCVFKNHDKTMLIGSSDKDGENDPAARKISLFYNYWLNCGQRCPFVRNSLCHVLNNVYDSDSNRIYNSQTSINARAGSVVCAENNYFGTVASPNEAGGSISYSPNSNFNPESYYLYVTLENKNVKSWVNANAGAGKVCVQ